MVTKMHSIFVIIIFTNTIFIYFAHAHTTQYAARFRNFTIESETGSAYLISMNIYRHDLQHFIAAKVNVTKHVKVKRLQIQLERCVYEKSACEYFQKFIIDKNIKQFVHMKNQFWTPATKSFKPLLDFPIVQKNIYESEDMMCDAERFLAFYPEATNYYFQLEAILFDFNGKKAVIVWLEVEFHSFVIGRGHRNRGNLSTK